jgi:hypothetical protein
LGELELNRRTTDLRVNPKGTGMKKAVILGLLGCAVAAQAQWAVGQTPSDFTCTDWDGGSWNLYEQRGKVVLINFGATW